MTNPDDAATEYQPVTVTAAAAAKINDLMAEKDMQGSALRVFVQGASCSGLQYGLAFVSETDEGDVVFESEGMRVHVDPVSIQYMAGSRIDVEQTPVGAAFKIDNPSYQPCSGCSSGSASGGCGSTDGCCDTEPENG